MSGEGENTCIIGVNVKLNKGTNGFTVGEATLANPKQINDCMSVPDDKVVAAAPADDKVVAAAPVHDPVPKARVAGVADVHGDDREMVERDPIDEDVKAEGGKRRKKSRGRGKRGGRKSKRRSSKKARKSRKSKRRRGKKSKRRRRRK